jgi:hypothetical protein
MPPLSLFLVIKNVLELGTHVRPLGFRSPDNLSVSELSGVLGYLFLSISKQLMRKFCVRGILCIT